MRTADRWTVLKAIAKVNTDGNAIGAMKPTGVVTTIGSLDTDLQMLKNRAGVFRDKVHRDLGVETTERFTKGDGANGNIGLPQGHDGRAACERPNRGRDLTM